MWKVFVTRFACYILVNCDPEACVERLMEVSQ